MFTLKSAQTKTFSPRSRKHAAIGLKKKAVGIAKSLPTSPFCLVINYTIKHIRKKSEQVT